MNRLRRAGCLEPGYWGGWQWTVDGERVANINFHAEPGRLILTYRFQQYGEEWQDIREPVRLVTVPCTYGGERTYFRCPGLVNGRHCGRRVAKLYGTGPYFLCRHCYGLNYASQAETRPNRLLRRANKKRMALGGEPGTASLLPSRPKGMHERTYQKHLEEINDLEEEADRAFMFWCLQRFGTSSMDEIFGWIP